jgi:hypothetical protein
VSLLGGIFVFLVLAAGAAVGVQMLRPVFQCPVCHSYKIREDKEDGYLVCEVCSHSWRSV